MKRQFFALFVAIFFLLPALVVARNNWRFPPEVYAMQLLKDRGHTEIAPIMVVDCAKAVRLLVAEGVDAGETHAVLCAKKNPPRAFRIVHADGTMDPTIYVVGESETYQMVLKDDRQSLLLLASAILHEDAHGHGANEQEALNEEVKFLTKELLNVSWEERSYLAERINFIKKLAKEVRH